MENQVPKQFLLLDKIPILMRTLHAFHRSTLQPGIVVVLAPDLQQQWTDLCYQHRFHVPHYIADGGETRFQSVRNGLNFLAENKLTGDNREQALIAVHDAARPLITPELIDVSFREAEQRGAVTFGVPSTDTIRWVNSFDSGENKILPRKQVYRIQTPQTFRAAILIEAYQQAVSEDFTDDVSVVEKMGIPITILNGDPQNIKITHRHDLTAAEAWLRDV